MSGIANHVVGLGLMLVQALLGVGFVIALIKITFGQREGCYHLVGLLFVAIVLALWQAGQLGSAIHEVITQIVLGNNPPSLGTG